MIGAEFTGHGSQQYATMKVVSNGFPGLENLKDFGFVEEPDVPALLEACGQSGFEFDMMDTSFFVSRETLIATARPGMALWRERVFVSMSRNAVKATDFFRVPVNRVVELGTQVEL